jgi:hypothetical protein
VPWREGGRLFYETRSDPDKQPILYSQDSLTAAATPILAPNRISRDGSVRDYAVSSDGRRVAYALAAGCYCSAANAALGEKRSIASKTLSPAEEVADRAG